VQQQPPVIQWGSRQIKKYQCNITVWQSNAVLKQNLWFWTASLWLFQSRFCQFGSPWWPVWSPPLWSLQMDLKGKHNQVLKHKCWLSCGYDFFKKDSHYVVQRLTVDIKDMKFKKFYTVLYHRLVDWFSSNQHKMRNFRALRRKGGGYSACLWVLKWAGKSACCCWVKST